MKNRTWSLIQTVSLILLSIVLLPGPSAHAATVDYQRTVVVSPIGTEIANGDELLAALAGITLPPPSATDRYLLKLEPGVYNVEDTAIQLPPYVDMEGSGEGVTLIRGNVGAALSASRGVVTVGLNAGIRQLTVENYADGAAIDSAAILLLGGSQATHVTAIATGSAVINRALMAASGVEPKPRASDVTATAATRAVQVFYPGLDAENLVAKGTEGMLVSSGDVFVRNSRLTGSNFSLLVTNMPQTVDLVTSQLTGDISCTFNNCRCFASYDEDLLDIKPKCVTKKGKK